MKESGSGKSIRAAKASEKADRSNTSEAHGSAAQLHLTASGEHAAKGDADMAQRHIALTQYHQRRASDLIHGVKTKNQLEEIHNA